MCHDRVVVNWPFSWVFLNQQSRCVCVCARAFIFRSVFCYFRSFIIIGAIKNEFSHESQRNIIWYLPPVPMLTFISFYLVLITQSKVWNRTYKWIVRGRWKDQCFKFHTFSSEEERNNTLCNNYTVHKCFNWSWFPHSVIAFKPTKNSSSAVGYTLSHDDE